MSKPQFQIGTFSIRRSICLIHIWSVLIVTGEKGLARAYFQTCIFLKRNIFRYNIIWLKKLWNFITANSCQIEINTQKFYRAKLYLAKIYLTLLF